MLRHAFAVVAGFLLASSVQAQPAVDALGDPLPPGAVARLGTLRFKHSSTPDLSDSNLPLATAVSAVHFSADGKRFVSRSGPYGTIRVWDGATGKNLPGDWDDRVVACEKAIAISPDGTLLAVHARDDKQPGSELAVLLWDVSAGRFLRSLPGDKGVRSAEFADDGKTLVTTHADAVRWWDVASGKEWRSWKPFGAAAARDRDDGSPLTLECHLTVSAGAQYLLATFWRRDDEVEPQPAAATIVFDLPTGKERWRLPKGKVESADCWLSTDGRRLACLVGKLQLDVHNAADGKRLFALPIEHQFFRNPMVRGITLSADGETVAIAGPDGHVYVWCVRDRKWRTYTVRPAHWWNSKTRGLAFSPDGTRLVVDSSTDLQVVDVATLKEVHSFDGHRGWVDDVAFSNDGKHLLTGGAQSDLHPREVLTWDTTTWKRLKISSDQVAPWPNIGIASPEHGVYLGKDGDDRLNFYDYATGKPLGRLQVAGKLDEEARGFFAPGGRFFVSLNQTPGEDRVGTLYAVPSGKRLTKLPRFVLPETAALRPVAFSPDGSLVAVQCLDGAVSLLETATGKEVHRLGPAPGPERLLLAHLVFSPDGKHLASWNHRENAIHLWDVRTGKKWLTLPDGRPTTESGAAYFAWSPDGRMFAVGAEDKIHVWELATRKLRCVIGGHEAEVQCLAFSPDSRLLASGSVNTTVLVWAVTGRAAAAPERVRRALRAPPN
jgi:WD40 repeat protein